jgi:hypothetical protein
MCCLAPPSSSPSLLLFLLLVLLPYHHLHHSNQKYTMKQRRRDCAGSARDGRIEQATHSHGWLQSSSSSSSFSCCLPVDMGSRRPSFPPCFLSQKQAPLCCGCFSRRRVEERTASSSYSPLAYSPPSLLPSPPSSFSQGGAHFLHSPATRFSPLRQHHLLPRRRLLRLLPTHPTHTRRANALQTDRVCFKS